MGRDAVRRVAAAVATVLACTTSVVTGVAVVAAAQAPTTASAAAGNPVRLPAAAVVDQRADVAAEITHTTDAGAFQLVVTMSTAVTAVNGDGSYTTRSTIGTVDVPSGAEIAGTAVNNLVSQSFEQSFAANGAAIPEASRLINASTMPPDQQEAGANLINAVSLVSVGFPAEPVAVGAAWTVPGTVVSHGITIPLTYQCTLSALNDSTYTLSVSYTQGFSGSNDSGVVEATVAGTGTIVGSLANPLVVSATVNQTIDGLQGGAPMHNDTSVSVNATAAG